MFRMKLAYRLLLLTIGVTLLTSFSAEANSKVSCGSKEKYICGPTCIETCQYKPEFGTKDCRYGCFCQEGYVRQSNKTDSPCIARKSCPKAKSVKCYKNEEYLTCGSACPQTCNDFSYPLPKPVRLCPALCKEGCFCKKGYYRQGQNKCVKPKKCCKNEKEEFRTCGTACPERCDFKPQVCTKQCVQGCFCKSADYVRKDNSTNSPCIKRKQCPTRIH